MGKNGTVGAVAAVLVAIIGLVSSPVWAPVICHAMGLCGGSGQGGTNTSSTASPVVTSTPGSPGALIAQLPKPSHTPWASKPIELIPLFEKTPSGGFDVGGLPYGTATWYVAWERGIVVHADAKDWVDNLAGRGYVTSRRPTVGAIVSWQGFTPGYGSPGHVALVVDVDPDGRGFTVAEANVIGVGRADVRWIPLPDPGIVGFVP